MTDLAMPNAARSVRSADRYNDNPLRRDAVGHRALVSRPRLPAVMPTRTPAKANSAHDPARRRASIFPKVFTVAVLLALWLGWVSRDDNGLTPVSGAGYWLGVAGSVLMLALLLYPLRKRLRSLRAIGSVTFWFNTHMILGVLGPVLIIWHANFRLGSINCSVALITTLVVAISGVFGRYLYSKVNATLYWRKTEAREVVADADELRGFLGSEAEVADRMVAQLNAYAQLGTVSRGALIGAGRQDGGAARAGAGAAQGAADRQVYEERRENLDPHGHRVVVLYP
jgi:hypothetical protein